MKLITFLSIMENADFMSNAFVNALKSRKTNYFILLRITFLATIILVNASVIFFSEVSLNFCSVLKENFAKVYYMARSRLTSNSLVIL